MIFCDLFEANRGLQGFRILLAGGHWQCRRFEIKKIELIQKFQKINTVALTARTAWIWMNG